MSVEQIIERLNEWRGGLVGNISEGLPYTDDLNGPVRNLPPLTGDELSMLQNEAQKLLADGWTDSLVESYLRFTEDVCPFWTEDYALKRMKQIRDKAILQGARR